MSTNNRNVSLKQHAVLLTLVGHAADLIKNISNRNFDYDGNLMYWADRWRL